MKYGFALNAGLGALLVVSSLGMQKGDKRELELSLDRTVHTLEELSGLRTRVEHGDRDAIADVIQRSAPAGKDPNADAERLSQLRFEVSRLQTDWDALAAAAAAKGVPLMHVLGSTSPTASKPTKDATTALTSFEAPGFSADPLRQGEALYHAGKYDDALVVLRAQADDPRCQYWCARSLESLGRVDEAIALYTSVSARKDASWAGERARTDLELLKWKQENEKQAPVKPKPAPTTTPSTTVPSTEKKQP
jgi:tetratricopeptide (TPR) repeat protein